MNRERMLDLISVLRAVPAKRFNMSTWAERTSCGTVGCAAGHYLIQRPKVFKLCSAWWNNDRKVKELMFNRQPLANYFGISDQEFIKLFFPMSYVGDGPVTKTMVLRTIREFVGTGKN